MHENRMFCEVKSLWKSPILGGEILVFFLA